MVYPRIWDGELVQENQMVEVREHLLQEYRVVILSGVIGGGSAEIPNWLLALDTLSQKPIKLIINSPGGDLDTAFQFYDTLRLLRSPVWTLGRYCASAAFLIFAAGQKRLLLPHAKVMLHLPSGQALGDARDWEIQHREMRKYKDKMVAILRECGATKMPDEILRDIDRDFWLEPEEAIAYGLADKIATKEDMEEWLPLPTHEWRKRNVAGKCPWCGSTNMEWADEEYLVCLDCCHKTDYYEAKKQAEK